MAFVAAADIHSRVALSEALAATGLLVVLFPNAETLLRALARMIPTIIVAHVSMPGLSGPDLLHALRLDERWRRIPVVVMTANNDTVSPMRLDVPVIFESDTDGLVAMIQCLRPSN